MKYTPKRITGNVNVSSDTPLKDFFVLLAGLLGILVIAYMALGFTVDFIVPKLPDEAHSLIDKVYDNMFVTENPTKVQIYIQSILNDTLNETSLGSKKFKLHIVNFDMPNALALPGNNIVLTTSLVNELESVNELVFVLAHELGHFANKDHLRGLGRGIIAVAMSVFLFGAESGLSDFVMNSISTIEFRFTKSQETNADIYALDVLYKKYGHVDGALDFFIKMSKKDKLGRVRYFFATHPYPEDRINFLRSLIANNKYPLKEKDPFPENMKISPEEEADYAKLPKIM